MVYDSDKLDMKAHELIKQIAVVNVKKSEGTVYSDNDNLWGFAKQDKDLLKRELELIDADRMILSEVERVHGILDIHKEDKTVHIA